MVSDDDHKDKKDKKGKKEKDEKKDKHHDKDDKKDKKDKDDKKEKKEKHRDGGYDGGHAPTKWKGDHDEGGDVDWMFNDSTLGGMLSSLNPLRWSGPVSYKEAMNGLKEQVESGEDRPVILRIPADAEQKEYASCKEAIAMLMKCKKVKGKALKQGMQADDLVRLKAKTKLFEDNFGFERPDIKHMVVLMLENRTFDGVQGAYMNERYENGLQRSMWDADGQDLYSYTNPVEAPDGTSVDFPVWSLPADDPGMMSRENMSCPAGPAGPVEKFHFLNMCSYGVMKPEQQHIDDGPAMAGFAQQYYTKEINNMPEDGSTLLPGIAGTDFENARSPAMHVFRKEQMPVLTALMENFGCSDTHFSSAPCQTWPNRLFASCGTCYGYYNNLPYVNEKAAAEGAEDETHYFQSEILDKAGSAMKMLGSYDTDTVFHRLNEHDVSWGIYHGQASLAILTTKLKYDMGISDNVGTLADFKTDCAVGDLPEFVWLEPNYDPADPEANDMHPPANVLHGQKLIADVYNTLRENEDVWNHCLFIITCDEGVGSFDHVKPPAAVDPEVGHDHEYMCQVDGSPYEMSTNPFTRFGTRVPNLLVSPFIEAQTVVRPKGHDEGTAPYPFDHTSIIRTAFDLFLGDPEESLTKRDAAAPSFVHALQSKPVNPGPLAIVCPPFDSDPTTRKNHTCHSAGQVSDLLRGGFEGSALGSTFKVELAALFGI